MILQKAVATAKAEARTLQAARLRERLSEAKALVAKLSPLSSRSSLAPAQLTFGAS